MDERFLTQLLGSLGELAGELIEACQTRFHARGRLLEIGLDRIDHAVDLVELLLELSHGIAPRAVVRGSKVNARRGRARSIRAARLPMKSVEGYARPHEAGLHRGRRARRTPPGGVALAACPARHARHLFRATQLPGSPFSRAAGNNVLGISGFRLTRH